MKNLSIYILILFLFGGCSFQTPPNNWQYKSVNAFDSYTKNFLSSNDKMAENDIQRAISHAKSSADLTQLAHIYLGECALNISVGVDDRCEKYKDIADVVNSKKLNAYYDFLNSDITNEEIDNLPNNYQTFARYLDAKDYKNANTEILNINKSTSQLLAASLLKEHIEEKTIIKVIDNASFNGYKKAVIFWLKKLKSITTDKATVSKIDKKISILQD
jgi:hypothetical protein